MNTEEKSYIYKEATNGNQLSDKHAVTPNKIWETKLKNQTQVRRSDLYLFHCVTNVR